MTASMVEKVKNSKPFTALDCVVVVAVIVVAVFIGLSVYRAPATAVSITVDGQTTSYLLGGESAIELDHLTVHISGGEVWVTGADCPDKTCVHTGKITRAGQSIVCLPNGIVITINGDGDLVWEIGR